MPYLVKWIEKNKFGHNEFIVDTKMLVLSRLAELGFADDIVEEINTCLVYVGSNYVISVDEIHNNKPVYIVLYKDGQLRKISRPRTGQKILECRNGAVADLVLSLAAKKGKKFKLPNHLPFRDLITTSIDSWTSKVISKTFKEVEMGDIKLIKP